MAREGQFLATNPTQAPYTVLFVPLQQVSLKRFADFSGFASRSVTDKPGQLPAGSKLLF